MPREEKFFDLFEAHAAKAEEAAASLRAILEEGKTTPTFAPNSRPSKKKLTIFPVKSCKPSAAALSGRLTVQTSEALPNIGKHSSKLYTITSSIVGVGSARRASAERWGLAGRIVWAWIITIPAAALTALLFHLIGSLAM